VIVCSSRMSAHNSAGTGSFLRCARRLSGTNVPRNKCLPPACQGFGNRPANADADDLLDRSIRPRSMWNLVRFGGITHRARGMAGSWKPSISPRPRRSGGLFLSVPECVEFGSAFSRWKRGSGTENAKHPSGRSGFRYLTPFPRPTLNRKRDKALVVQIQAERLCCDGCGSGRGCPVDCRSLRAFLPAIDSIEYLAPGVTSVSGLPDLLQYALVRLRC
jgi:hypothetical protein